MPLIKLNRADKSGVILLNSEHILSVEVKDQLTTITLVTGQLCSVTESPGEISGSIELMAAERIKNAILYSGLGNKSI